MLHCLKVTICKVYCSRISPVDKVFWISFACCIISFFRIGLGEVVFCGGVLFFVVVFLVLVWVFCLVCLFVNNGSTMQAGICIKCRMQQYNQHMKRSYLGIVKLLYYRRSFIGIWDTCIWNYSHTLLWQYRIEVFNIYCRMSE